MLLCRAYTASVSMLVVVLRRLEGLTAGCALLLARLLQFYLRDFPIFSQCKLLSYG